MPPPSAASQGPGASSSSDQHQRPRKRPKIRRTTFACARCHRRKIRCDGLKPACSNCVQAKHPCNGILDGESKTVIPRSIAQYLQEKIQEKELLLRSLGLDITPDNAPAVAHPQVDSNGKKAAARQADQRFDLASETARSFSAGLSKELLVAQVRFPYGTFLFASSHLPSVTPAPVDSDHRDDHFRPKDGSNALEQIPKDVTERLVRNYIENISPLYPYLDRQDLWAQYHKVSNGQKPADSHSVFLVSMIVAISIMTSKLSDSAKVAMSSERIFQHALNHSDALHETSFRSLQATLLLIQYSYLMPRAASLWDIVGLAMRMALELGLHRDPDDLPGQPLSASSAELRRCVFWVLYIFDRSICATSHRRLGIADESISTKYPAGRDRSYFLHNLRFRRLQSELWTVNYLRRGLPLLTAANAYGTWVADIEARMHAWRASVCTTAPVGPPEWFDIALGHGLVFLHRPCPRNPRPPPSSLVTCFSAAAAVAAGYWANAHSGFLKYSWHAVHHGFEAAMAMLYAIRHCRHDLLARFGVAKIHDTAALFSSLFLVLSNRWSQALASLQCYERCKAVVMAELARDGPPAVDAEADELDRMILPQRERVQRVKRERDTNPDPGVGSESMVPFDPSTRLRRKPSSIAQQMADARPLTLRPGSPSSPAAVPRHNHATAAGAPSVQLPLVPTLPSSQGAWAAPQVGCPQQQQQVAFGGGGGAVAETYQDFYEGYDMWTVPGQAGLNVNANMDWEEVVMQPDQNGVEGMILWSM